MKKFIIILILIGLAIYFIGGSQEVAEAPTEEAQVEQEIESLDEASVELDAQLDELEARDFE